MSRLVMIILLAAIPIWAIAIAPAPSNSNPPCSMTVSTSVTNLKCYGDSNGTALAIPSGGRAPYTYVWTETATGITKPDSFIDNLKAGTYTITVEDANACVVGLLVTLTHPDSLSASITTTSVSCHDTDNGTASASVSGGLAPYQYLWTAGLPGVNGTVSNLQGGPASVVLEDNNGCVLNIDFTVDAPDPFHVISEITDVSCYGESTGAISLAISGGTFPFTINAPSVLNKLPAGSYLIDVSDTNGCNHTEIAEINQPDSPLTLSINVVNATCAGCFDGAILGVAKGGTRPYTLYGELRNLDSGYYYMANITVTDSKGCSVYESERGTILPVDLTYFAGKYVDDKAYLSWETGTELDNKGFAVMRKIGSQSGFESLAFIEGKGESIVSSSYHYIDSSPSTYETNYYRLIQEDHSGTTSPSHIISVYSMQKNRPEIATIDWSIPDRILVASTRNEVLNIRVTDISGRTLFMQNGAPSADVSTVYWTIGTYVIIVRNNKGEYGTWKYVKS